MARLGRGFPPSTTKTLRNTAYDVRIYANGHTSDNQRTASSHNTKEVWTDKDTGYVFILASPAAGQSSVRMFKTTDGGISWSAGTNIELDTAGSGNIFGIGIWYDGWTEGVTSKKIHVVWCRGGTTNAMRYRTVDTASSDTLGTIRSIATGLTTPSSTGHMMAPCRLQNGKVVVVWYTGTNHGCNTSTDEFASNNVSLTDPTETIDMWFVVPASTDDQNDFILAYDDVSADELSVKYWDDSAGTFTEYIVATGRADTSLTFVSPYFNWSIDKDRDALLMGTLPLSTTGDLNIYRVSLRDPSQAPTLLTQPIVDHGNISWGTSLFVDWTTGDYYVGYMGSDGTNANEARGSNFNFYYKKSTDGGVTWGAEQRFNVGPASNDTSGIGVWSDIGGYKSRFALVWYEADFNEVWTSYTYSIPLDNPTIVRSGQVTMSGTGDLTAIGDPVSTTTVVTGAAVISGTGATVIAALVIQQAATTMSGTGTLTADAYRIKHMQATTITGAGDIAAAALVQQMAATTMAGVGSTAITSLVIKLAATTMTGVGSTSITALAIKLAATTMSGSGSELVANAYKWPAIQTTFPLLRAGFYYGWYPEAWDQSGYNPFSRYQPLLGYYDSADTATIDAHLAMLEYAGIDVAIASWWSPTHWTHDNLLALLDRVVATNSPVRVAIYYEREGNLEGGVGPNPTAAQIASDLNFLKSEGVFDHPAFAYHSNKPMVFAYGDGSDDSEPVEANRPARRWHDALALLAFPLWISLKVYPDWPLETYQPDHWHQYAPAVRYDQQGSLSAAISAGFYRIDEGSPRLVRDLAAFESAVADAVAASVDIIFFYFNEWGEGTAIEPDTTVWDSVTGFGDYLDALSIYVRGAASLSGAGALSASGYVIQQGATAMSGAGAIAAAGIVIQQAATTMAGTGALTAVATNIAVGATTMSGTGSTAILSYVIKIGATTMSGTGATVIVGLTIQQGATTMSGAGAITALATVTKFAAAVITGNGALVAAAVDTSFATAAIAGNGALVGVAVDIIPAAAAISGVGALTASGLVLEQGAVAMVGTGTATGQPVNIVLAAATISGNGALSAIAEVSGVVMGAATLSGTGSGTATAVVTTFGVTTMAGNGALTASSVNIPLGATTMAGSGVLAATATVTILSAATIAGTGVLTATATVTHFAAATIPGTGTMSTAGLVLQQGQTALAGNGAIAASGATLELASTTLSGTGALNASGVAIRDGAAALSGAGFLAASGYVIQQGAAALAGSGALAADSRVIQNASTTLAGAGILTGAALVYVLGVSTISGNGSATASGTATILGVATITGIGALDASGLQITFATAALAGSGDAPSAATLIVFAAAALSGQGDLVGHPEENGVILGRAAMVGTGDIAGAAYVEQHAVAPIAGAGVATASALNIVISAPTLTAAGDITTGALVNHFVTVAMSGNGVATISGQTIQQSTSFLSGVGSLAAVAVVEVRGHTALPGAGALSTTALLEVHGATTLPGHGDISVGGAQVVTGAAVLSGQGSLAASGDKITSFVLGAALLSGAGSATTFAELFVRAQTLLHGSGSATATSLGLRFGTVTLHGAGSAAALARLFVYGDASLEGDGDLTATEFDGLLVGAGITASIDMQVRVIPRVVYRPGQGPEWTQPNWRVWEPWQPRSRNSYPP